MQLRKSVCSESFHTEEQLISLQTRTKLQQTLMGVLNCCKIEIVFQCQILSVTKTLPRKTLYLVLFINFSVVSVMSPIMVKVPGT